MVIGKTPHTITANWPAVRSYATLKDSNFLRGLGMLTSRSSPAPPKGHQEHWKDYQLHEDDCLHQAEPSTEKHAAWPPVWTDQSE